MLIECIAKVSGTVETAISNDVYVFRPDAQGRLVCDVDREDHQAVFLAVEGVYRQAEVATDPAPDASPAVDPEPVPQADIDPPTLPTELSPSIPAEGSVEGLEGKTWDELAALYDASPAVDPEPVPQADIDPPTLPTELSPSIPAEGSVEGLEGKTWDELAALYEAKFDRKPHSKASVATLIERLTA